MIGSGTLAVIISIECNNGFDDIPAVAVDELENE